LQGDIRVVVGNRIAKLRKAKGFSQDQFAEMLGMNHAQLYRLETGQQYMTLKTLTLLADALEVRITRLLRGF
jgi:transcriptional regulator with XRE-family HTH domain